MQNFVSGIGNPEAKLMIVGEAPGKHENDQGVPFVGPAGGFLDRYCKAIGHPNWRSECYITNVVKLQPIDNDFTKLVESGIDLKKELDFFLQEVHTINPNMILFLGANAYKSVGLPPKWDERRGSILQAFGRKCMVTYHPARFLYTPGIGKGSWKPFEKAVFQHDLNRAFNEAEFRPANLPARNLYVADDSNKFMQFLNRWDGKSDRYASDIESINYIPFCVSFAFNPYEAVSVPLFDGPLGRTRSLTDKSRLWLLVDKVFGNKKLKLIGQNWKYDGVKLGKLGFKTTLHSDIMLKGHVICPEFPKSLEFMTTMNTREPFYKLEYDKFITGKSSIHDFMIYNCRDSAVTLEIDDQFNKDLIELDCVEFYNEFVNELHDLYCAIEEVGFAIDEDVRQELIREWCRKQAEIEIELFKILGMHLNVQSYPQVQLALYERLKLPFRKGTGEDVLIALLGNYAKKPEQKRAIELILKDRKIRRLLSTTLSSPPDYDGRMRTSVFIPATETRRTADDILAPPIRPFNCGIGFKTLSKHGEAGIIRKMFKPDSGYVFLNFDQSQAEARVCSLLADDEETLRNFDKIDIHALTASWAFGGNEQKWSKKVLGYEAPERFIGKTLRHAGHLDMQKRTCMITINTDAAKYGIPVEVSEWKAGILLDTFHKYTPKIRSIFHEGVRQALIDGSMFLRGASPCVGKNWYPPRQFFGDWDRDLWKEAYAFIPQQSVSDKTKWVLMLLRKHAGFLKLIGESHDAGLALCPENKIDEAVEMVHYYGEQPISFEKCSIIRRDLVIPFDCEIGYENYKDLKKYKKVKLDSPIETTVAKKNGEINAEELYKAIKSGNFNTHM